MEKVIITRTMVIFCYLLCYFTSISQTDTGRWDKEKDTKWYQHSTWLRGCNFIPSTAINQLEMWQADTFDSVTIDRELGWAAEVGFNTMRVFLHNLLWEQDSSGFLQRMEQYLTISDKHGINNMFVLFDGVWDPYPKLGIQPKPVPHVHNSGWLQSPGAAYLSDPQKWGQLKSYVQGVIRHFANDPRIVIWDLFNEADNPNLAYRKIEIKDKGRRAYELLRQTFRWAREVNPSQPLTVCVWRGKWSPLEKASDFNKLALGQSDVLTFHSYDKLRKFRKLVESLSVYERPMMCTEYMARRRKSTFKTILPYLKENKIGAYNWGLVSGKTQTIYPWRSWVFKMKKEPKLWFHDILRKDGSPFDDEEIRLIKNLTR